ncbi:THUMP-like domain-containing protein [Spirosoma pollinicola]|uniref:SAM-dependent methyltransferase n=1 Tax=Spirosoma pollinicola TaxID=2057025 RepID=A0A2K8YYX0_9BACT|nr:SAM-dependent methyltransferase [Spirosoma pollinicola]AUD02748.1 SAM-dependent methyltransferase [Spirosoma pollinicola]
MITISLVEREFIRTHISDDVRSLLLRAQPHDLDIRKVAAQIVARQKAQEKLLTWFANDELIFPPALSVEQASSEQTAHYKASLVSGRRLFDLTGGMGVDTWAFAKRVEQVVYVERNEELAQLAAHNLPLLGTNNVSVKTGDGLALLMAQEPTADLADWIYLDPHRRDSTGGKVVRLEDCEPDVSQHGTLKALFSKANRVLLKASPLLDIQLAIRQLMGFVASVHVVAVQGEVKEVLFVLGNQVINKDDVQFNTVNLVNNMATSLNFCWDEEAAANVNVGDPQTYIYEPNAAVLKAGAFRLAGARFGLKKLAPHSHLYTNDDIQWDFPGRIFSVLQVIKPDAKILKTIIPDLKANLTVRNFPQTVAELRKKLSLREGGDIYILATTLQNGDKRLLITKKVNRIHS